MIFPLYLNRMKGAAIAAAISISTPIDTLISSKYCMVISLPITRLRAPKDNA